MAEHFRAIANKLIGKPKGGISYREIEIQTGYPFGYVQKIVAGKKPLPRNLEFYESVAKALHIKPEEIIEHNELRAEEKLRENPKLADAILDEDITALASSIAELNEEERKEVLELIREDIAKLHKKE